MTEPHVNPNESANSTSLGLLERVKARDQSAWNRMVSLYSPLLDYWLGKAALQAADAADYVRQEVFLAVARKIADFRRDRDGDSFAAGCTGSPRTSCTITGGGSGTAWPGQGLCLRNGCPRRWRRTLGRSRRKRSSSTGGPRT